MTAGPECPPRPPQSFQDSVQTPVNTDRVVTLLAADDGLPDPPGGITYIVTSLPTYKLRILATGQVITPADLPFALPSGVKQVLYRPTGFFNGVDRFTFVTDDGGVPPEALYRNRGKT